MSMRPRILLLAWFVGLVLLAVWNGFTLRLSTDLSHFLPSGTSQQDHVLLSQVRGGIAARTLLVRVHGEKPSEALADASRALAEALRGDDAFLQVANGDIAEMIGPVDETLFRYRYLIGPLDACAQALNLSALRVALEARLSELASGVALLDRQSLPADPTACYRQFLHSLIPRQAPSRQHGVWLSPDSRDALLVVVTSAMASDLNAQRRAVERIQDAFAALSQGDALTLELAGPGYFAVGSETRIKTETQALSVAATLAVTVILVLAFRSAALVLLGMLPLLSGVMVGAALVSLLYGEVQGIALALGITLLGVALDYPVHVFTHLPGNNPKRTARVWRALMLGMLTSVIGYGALAWTSFDGLSQLGIFAAAGLSTAALTSRYLLPALMPAGYRLPERRWLASLSATLPQWTPRVGIWLLLGSLAGLGLTLMMQGSPWESDIRRLSTVPKAEIDKDRLIRAQLSAPDVARLLYAVSDTETDVLERLETALPDLMALQEQGLIDGFNSIARWLPSPREQEARRASLPERSQLIERLSVANADLPFRLERFAPFLDAVEDSRTLAPLQVAELANGLIAVPAAMLLQRLEDRWLGLVPLSGVDGAASEVALQDLAEHHGLHYLDLGRGAAELMDGFFSETLGKLVITAILIALVLAIALRSSRRLGRALLPIGITLVMTFMLVLIVQGAANLFHLVSLLLVAGLAIDYSLFLNRAFEDDADRRCTLFSVSLCAASSFAMFALLALSAIPALQAIGFTVAAGILLAYFTSLLLAKSEPLG